MAGAPPAITTCRGVGLTAAEVWAVFLEVWAVLVERVRRPRTAARTPPTRPQGAAVSSCTSHGPAS